ncbi:MAG: PKD domain-containing protein [Fibrobacter sp.]|nr:PKD domain-containing protein [Fibrobacter sp.]
MKKCRGYLKICILSIFTTVFLSACGSFNNDSEDDYYYDPSNPYSPSGSNSSKSAPIANFTYSGDDLAPAKITFKNTTTNATTYSWDFGDNKTSSSESPSHTFEMDGVYTVTLTAGNSYGVSESSKTINIKKPGAVEIKKMVLKKVPLTKPNGGGWDILDGPDIYIKLKTKLGASAIKTWTESDVTSSDIPLTYSLKNPYKITNFSTDYVFELWDEDLAADDFMSGFYFSANQFITSKYNDVFTLKTSDLEVEFHLIWSR